MTLERDLVQECQTVAAAMNAFLAVASSDRMREAKRPPRAVNSGGLTPEVSPMLPESTRFVRVNLLHAHGSPTRYLYCNHGCRCDSCRSSSRDYQSSHRVERAVYDAAYRASHRAELAEYRRANKESIRATISRWNQSHPEKSAEYSRRYNASHAEQRASARKEWEAKNLERARERARAYRELHADRYRQHNRNHSAKRRSAEGSHTDSDIRAQLTRQKGRCFWCSERLSDYQPDHVVPLALGGTNWPDNIVVSCPECNHKKRAAHPMDWAGVMF